MMTGLEQQPDLVFMIGYHAKSQTRGVLAHDQQLCVHAGLAERRRAGEAGCGALAREYGAHVALATGDDVFAEETQPLFPDAHFETVKTAGGASSGDTLTPAASCARIAAAAREAVAHALSAGVRAGAIGPRRPRARCACGRRWPTCSACCPRWSASMR